MSRQKLKVYSDSIEAEMCFHFNNLSEKDQRHYAAIEARKIGYGGITYIANLFKITRNRIHAGISELKNLSNPDEIPPDKQRRLGGGRKKKLRDKDILNQLHALIKKYKAGSPTDSNVYFIFLTARQLSRCYEKEYGIPLGQLLIRRELRRLGYKYRKLHKTVATDKFDDRDLQFKNIFELVSGVSLETPIASLDCKKKERLGNLYRDGQCFSSEVINVYDHDYQHLSTGKVVPHGIYDLQLNKGYISIGGSSETAEFIIENILWWWTTYGIHHYPDAKQLVLLCDSGGGNSYRHHAFKKQLQKLAKEIGIDIIVCHYPPYASKWNPIEHRLFCHVHQAMKGILFTSYEVVQKAIENTETKTGLTVVVRLNLKEYKKGIKTSKDEVDEKRIQFGKIVPKLNYRIAA